MLTLVLGGAASGKSEYAEALVLRSALPRYYLATMQVWDAECAARVEKHRKMRCFSIRHIRFTLPFIFLIKQISCR